MPSRVGIQATADVAPLTRAGLERYVIGERFATRWRTVTEADVVSFSAWTGDWHPQHSDATWAADSSFGQRVAHGMLVLSYAFGLIDFDPGRIQALRSLRSVVFKRPVFIGSTIGVVGTVTDVRLVGEVSLLVLGLRVRDPDDRAFLYASLEILLQGDEEVDAGAGVGGIEP